MSRRPRLGGSLSRRIRKVEIHDASVDKSAKYVAMPKRRIEQLGLKNIETVEVKTVSGPFGSASTSRSS